MAEKMTKYCKSIPTEGRTKNFKDRFSKETKNRRSIVDTLYTNSLN